MFEKFFEKYLDYQPLTIPSAGLIETYQGRIPDDLLYFWEKFGFGIYMDGYLKVIDPGEYLDSLHETYLHYEASQTVFAVTSLCDYLIWDGDSVELINYRHGYSKVVGSDELDWYFDMDLTDEYYLNSQLKHENYAAAKLRLGEAAYDEGYGYVPVLAAGGPEKAENLQKVKIIEHVSLITQLGGKIS